MSKSIRLDEETNALDYLDRAIRFLREVEAGDFLADPRLGFDVFVALIVVATAYDWRDVRIVPWLVYSDNLVLVG